MSQSEAEKLALRFLLSLAGTEGNPGDAIVELRRKLVELRERDDPGARALADCWLGAMGGLVEILASPGEDHQALLHETFELMGQGVDAWLEVVGRRARAEAETKSKTSLPHLGIGRGQAKPFEDVAQATSTLRLALRAEDPKEAAKLLLSAEKALRKIRVL